MAPAADPILSALRAAATPGGLLPPGARVLVACSGGADSVALAHALATLARERPGTGLAVCLGHVDHALREGSQAEAEAVRRLGARLRVPVLVERLGSLRAQVRAQGLEAAAREARYAALERLARAAGATVVATAHTRRDQAETVLLRLARGGGVGALAGVRPARALGAVRLVRPLLGVGRDETEAYCRRRRLRAVSDPHNADPRRARARLREAFAALDALLGPRLEEALARAASLAQAEDDLVAGLAAEALARLRTPEGLRVDGLLALPLALQRRVLLSAAAAAGLRPSLAHLEEVRALCGRRPGALELPGGVARVARGLLRLGPPPPAPALGADVAVPGPGRYALGALALRVAKAPAAPPDGLVLVDAARAPLPWTLRHARPGDRFRPGGGREKKLADLWIDARVPRAERPGLAVLADAAGRLFWAEGLRPGDPARGRKSAPLALTWARAAPGSPHAPAAS